MTVSAHALITALFSESSVNGSRPCCWGNGREWKRKGMEGKSGPVSSWFRALITNSKIVSYPSRELATLGLGQLRSRHP